MSKRNARAQASSARAAASAFSSGFGASPSPAFGTSSSQLSYVTEPPDLSAVSDPNVVVYFRNLSKKDSTTKAKALEDIQGHVSSLQEPVEEGVLEAWVGLMHTCIYGPCSNSSLLPDQNLSPHLDRQCKVCSPACTLAAWPHSRVGWQEDSEAHAQGCGCLAFWALRHR